MPLHHGPPQFCSCKHLTESDENGALWFCILCFRIGSRKRTRASTRATYVTFTFRAWSGDRERAGHTRRVQDGTVFCAWYSRTRQRGTESGCETMMAPRFNFYFFSHSAPYFTSHTSHTAPPPGPGASGVHQPWLWGVERPPHLGKGRQLGELSLVISLGSTPKSAYRTLLDRIQNTVQYPGRFGPWSISHVLRGGQPGLPAHVCATSVMKRLSRHARLAFF